MIRVEFSSGLRDMIALLLLLKGVFFIFDKGERLQRLKWSNKLLKGLFNHPFRNVCFPEFVNYVIRCFFKW